MTVGKSLASAVGLVAIGGAYAVIIMLFGLGHLDPGKLLQMSAALTTGLAFPLAYLIPMRSEHTGLMVILAIVLGGIQYFTGLAL